MDPHGIVTSWNAGAERMFGCTAAEAIGRSIRDISDRRRTERALAEVRAEQVDLRRLSTIIDASGRLLMSPRTANAILGCSRMLAKGTMPEERKARAYEVLDKNASVLTQIVEDVLDLSRIVSSKIRLALEPTPLEPVVVHSIESAVKFTRRGGWISVRMACGPHTGEVAVADDGTGIIARQIVEMHGGAIEAESAGAGRGSTFRVILPLLED